MPRIRYLKPDFFTDEDLAELPFKTRIAFAGLWCYADKAGRFEDRPRYLKAMIFPYDTIDMEKELELLASPKKSSGCPFIYRYSVDGKKYIQILTWDEHQRPHHTEKDSEIPEPDDLPPTPPLTTKTKEGIEKGMGMENQLNPSTELKNVSLPYKQPLNDVVTEIIDYLNKKTGKEFRSDNKETKSLIRSRMKEGYLFEDFKAVIDNQSDRWLADDKMRDFLRPRTLFSTKFESYLNCNPRTNHRAGTPGEPPKNLILDKIRQAQEKAEKEKNGKAEEPEQNHEPPF